jgi:heme exporter protein C
MSSAERAMGKLTARKGERILAWLSVASMAVAALFALVIAPREAVQGNVFRLIYLHVPTAWLAYLAFTVVLVGSVAYLITRKIRWDRLAAASAEIGVLFTALTIVLGSLWAKPVWGTFWTWDPRLTTTAIMLLVYVGYLAVRRLPDNPAKRARWAAVVGIISFLDVPIVHLSVRWWRGQHQAPARLLGVPDMAPLMGVALMIALAAFTVLYLYLLALRLRVGRLEDRLLQDALAPRLEPSAALTGAGQPGAEAPARG